MRSAPPATPSAPRRRRQDQPRQKTSLSIRAEVLDAAKELVRAGEAENLSAFVEAAVDEKIRRTKRAALYEAYVAAARDDAFVSDMRSVGEAFRQTDADGL